MRSSVKVSMLGNWPKAVKTFATLSPVVKRSIAMGQRKYARKLVAIVKGHIIQQDLGWKAASPSKRGSMLMIDTRDYYQSIRYWQKNYELHVGVPEHLIHGRSGQKLWKVATWNERGTKKIPARPLWGPSIKELGGTKQVAIDVRDEIQKNLSILGLGVLEVKKT